MVSTLLIFGAVRIICCHESQRSVNKLNVKHELCVPVKFTAVPLKFPKIGVSLLRQMTACTIKLHRVMKSDVRNLVQATVVSLIVSGHTPQFVCKML